MVSSLTWQRSSSGLSLLMIICLAIQQTRAQFGLPMFPGGGASLNLGLPSRPSRPASIFGMSPFRFGSSTFNDNSFGVPPPPPPPPLASNSFPFGSWSSPWSSAGSGSTYTHYGQAPRPQSPARQCRSSGQCKQIDFGTTMQPSAKMIPTTTAMPPLPSPQPSATTTTLSVVGPITSRTSTFGLPSTLPVASRTSPAIRQTTTTTTTPAPTVGPR